MKIATGHPVTGDEAIHDFKAVRFLTDDGRAMFEVCIGEEPHGRPATTISLRGARLFATVPLDGRVGRMTPGKE